MSKEEWSEHNVSVAVARHAFDRILRFKLGALADDLMNALIATRYMPNENISRQVIADLNTANFRQQFEGMCADLVSVNERMFKEAFHPYRKLPLLRDNQVNPVLGIENYSAGFARRLSSDFTPNMSQIFPLTEPATEEFPQEFQSIIRGVARDALTEIIEKFPNLVQSLSLDWIRVVDASEKTVDEPSSQEDFRSSTIQALDDLRAQVQQLTTGYGQIGHNGGPSDFPITPNEQASAIEAIDETRNAITTANPDPTRVQVAWSKVVDVASKLGKWGLAKADLFVTGLATEGGKSVGQHLPKLIYLAIAIWLGFDNVSAMISKLLGG